jgi:uncharacterized protein
VTQDQSPDRIATLDILRGVAVMGILAMNVMAFAMPEPAYFNPQAYGGATGVNLVAWVSAFILFDSKMRGLFSMLFGASMLLVIQTAEAKGENPASVHYRRILWLLLFGAIHYYLIWWGDILLNYAMIALIAFFFHSARLQTLLFWIFLLMVGDMFVMGMLSHSFLELSHQASLPGASPEILGQWASTSGTFSSLSPAALASDLALHRGDYGALLQHRFATDAWSPFQYLFLGGFETLAFMLVGMAGLRSGFLTGDWAPALYRRIAIWGIGLGATGYAAMAAIAIRSGFDPATLFAACFGGTTPFRLPMFLGYAALIILATRKGGWLVERIAAAGRAAFSNYIGTSIVMTCIFYGWGLGLYGRFQRAEV